MFVSVLVWPVRGAIKTISRLPAAVLYATSVFLASLASAAHWWYASGRGALLRPGVSGAQIRGMRARGLAGPVLFALSVPVALVAPYAAEVLWILVFPVTRIAYAWFAEEREPQD